MKPLLPVAETLARIVAGVAAPVEAEWIAIEHAAGRVLAAPLVAARTQPPFRASAMDGYAVRAADLIPGQPLRLVGESAAGRRFDGVFDTGDAVRIFTGAPLPDGADTILIQENARSDGALVYPSQTETPGRFVRGAGLDFVAGDEVFPAGRRLRPTDLATVASLGHGRISVRRKPRIAVLATGDELVLPGETLGPDQIIASNHLSVCAIAEAAGAEARFLGIARDTLDSLDAAITKAIDWPADALITLGGASVGDHDLVRPALARRGMALDFWRIAMRPGKPLMYGGIDAMRVLGLPGNPTSSVVCAHVFMKPLIARMLGDGSFSRDRTLPGRLARALPANDERQDYLRARLTFTDDGSALVDALPRQDSSLTLPLAEADALLVRPPHAPAEAAGAPCRYLPID